MYKILPKEYSKRAVKKFAWLPKRIYLGQRYHIWIWLEFYYVIEEYTKGRWVEKKIDETQKKYLLK